MPQALDDCVAQLLKDGYKEDSAFAICQAAINAEEKPEKWTEVLWEKVKKFSKVKAALGDGQVPPEAQYREGRPGCDTCLYYNYQNSLCTLFNAIVAPLWTCNEYAQRQMMSKTFKNVEIARTGKFEASTGTVTFTREDFDNAEVAYKTLGKKHKAPIKLGHDDEQKLLQEDGLPNAGILSNIHRDEDKLVADLVDVPDEVAELVEKGRFNARSIEALRNARIGNKRWPFVITGLALLGADLPAVDSLKDVVALYANRGIKPPEATDPKSQVIMVLASTYGEGAEVDVDTVINELHKVLERAEAIVRHRGGAPKFRTLVRSAVDELRTIAKKKAKKAEEDMDTKTLAAALGLPETATEDEILAALAAQVERVKELEAKLKAGGSDEGETASLKAELKELRTTVVTLTDAAATNKATEKVDGAIKARKFTPASRGTLIKMAVSSPTEFDELLKATPNGAVIAKAGEQGSDGDGSGVPTDLEPTAIELDISKRVGLTREDIIATKARTAGVAVPESVAKVLAERAKPAKKE